MKMGGSIKSCTSTSIVTFAMVLTVLSITIVQVVEARPEPAQLAAMADAIKYLHQLDKYYSQMARPSTRSAPGAAMSAHNMEETLRRYLQLQDLGKFYVNKARPRFGKRSESAIPSDDSLLEASQRLLESLESSQR